MIICGQKNSVDKKLCGQKKLCDNPINNYICGNLWIKMSNFSFKRFTIQQERCAMKVGTDGVLLGAWAATEMEAARVRSVLDIGTGTGLIALMTAQRFPDAKVVAIDIDEHAAEQARENISQSPFSHNINVLHKSLQEYIHEENAEKRFDLIVCNPPFFDNSLVCPDPSRTVARHTSTLPFASLMKGARSLLADNGIFSLVIPSECRQKIEDEAIFAGLYLCRRTAVVTKEGKKPKRFLLEFGINVMPATDTKLSLESDEYRALTADFYLPKAEKR